MFAVLFAIITFLGWGSGDVFGTIASRKIGALSAIVTAYTIALVFFGLFIPFHLQELFKFSFPMIILTLILGIIIVIGNLTYTKALNIANPSLVGTLSGSAYAFIPVLSVIFLKEQLALWQWITIFIIFLGVVLSVVDVKDLTKKKGIVNGTFLSLITLCCWAIGFTFIKFPTRQVGWFWPNYLTYTMIVVIFFIMKLRKTKFTSPFKNHAFLPLLTATILVHGGDFAYNVGILHGYASIVAPIAGAYPVLFALLSFFVFREPLRLHQKLGIVVTLVGIVALSFLSS